jgi:hypothetical protein
LTDVDYVPHLDYNCILKTTEENKMVTFFLSALGLATIGFYGYMGVLAGWGASKSGDGVMKAAGKGAVWPLSMYFVMKKMFDTKPPE